MIQLHEEYILCYSKQGSNAWRESIIICYMYNWRRPLPGHGVNSITPQTVTFCSNPLQLSSNIISLTKRDSLCTNHVPNIKLQIKRNHFLLIVVPISLPSEILIEINRQVPFQTYNITLEITLINWLEYLYYYTMINILNGRFRWILL